MKKLLGSLLIAVFALTIGTVYATDDDFVAPTPLERLQQPQMQPKMGGVKQLVNNTIYKVEQGEDGICKAIYIWVGEATVEQISTEKGKNIQPGRPLLILNIHPVKDYPQLTRSKAHIEAGVAAQVIDVPIHEGQHINDGDVLFTFKPAVLLDDSVLPSDNADMSFKSMLKQLWQSTGIYEFIVRTGEDWTLGIGRLLMICVGFVLLYLAIFKGFEPLLLVPIGYGAIMSNIPLAGIATPDGILGILFKGVDLGIYPLLIFLGIGAMTDFAPLIANPWTALLGAAAQLGIFGALFGAVLLSKYVPGITFTLKDAASIGIIGGADGPTAIFLSSKLAPNLLGSIAVAADSYMALVPIIQPPIIKALTSKEERLIRMTTLRKVTKLEKVVFPLIIVMLCCLLLPSAAPLISMLMLGNVLKECMCTDRLSETAQNALCNIVTIFLGLSVGSKLSADKFLNLNTLGILLLGLIAFSIGTAGGVIFGKIMCKLTGGKVNPMIGAAGVSAVPMAARVVNKIGLQEDPQNFLLMHAMGPNVSGVIGSAVAAGVLLCALGNL